MFGIRIVFIYIDSDFPPYSLSLLFTFARLYLSGTYCHKTGTKPPSCGKSQQPTMYTTNVGPYSVGQNNHFILVVVTKKLSFPNAV